MAHFRFVLSIRGKLSALIVALGVLIAVLCVQGVLNGGTAIITSQQAVRVNAAFDALVEAAGALAVERGTVQAGLSANAGLSLTAAQHDLVAARRHQADTVFARASQTITELGTQVVHSVAQPLDALQQSRTRANDLRARVERGGPAVANAWFPGITD